MPCVGGWSKSALRDRLYPSRRDILSLDSGRPRSGLGKKGTIFIIVCLATERSTSGEAIIFNANIVLCTVVAPM